MIPISFLTRRKFQTLCYGWKDAGLISAEIKSAGGNVSRLRVFLEIQRLFVKYHLFSMQYKAQRMWEMDVVEKESLAMKIGSGNLERDLFISSNMPAYLENYRFLSKFTRLEFDVSQSRRDKRNEAYRKRYNFGRGCLVQYGVMITSEHLSDAQIESGDFCLFARGCDLDYTGGLQIGAHVHILEGVKILTHDHDTYGMMDESKYIRFSNKAYKTPLVIGDGVTICARAIILPGVGEIGEGSKIQSGAIVDKQVPPYTMVCANGKRIKIPRWAEVNPCTITPNVK